MKKSLLYLLLIGIPWIYSCSGTDGEQEAMLQGQWQCVHVERGTEVSDGQGIAFNFEGDAYTYKSGSYKEEGEFWVENEKLFTEGPQVMKKQVTLETLSKDSLVLGMNDRGVTMTMIFLKQ